MNKKAEPEDITVRVSDSQYRSFIQSFHLLHVELSSLFSLEELNRAKFLGLYSIEENQHMLLRVSDIRAAYASQYKRTQKLMNKIIQNQGIFRPNPYLINSDQVDFLHGVNVNTTDAVVVVCKQSGQVIAASRKYCEVTGKTLFEWHRDRRNNSRWESGFLSRLYEYIDESPDGEVIDGYEYIADDCINNGDPVQWISSFQQLFDDRDTRFRVCQVHQIGDCVL